MALLCNFPNSKLLYDHSFLHFQNIEILSRFYPQRTISIRTYMQYKAFVISHMQRICNCCRHWLSQEKAFASKGLKVLGSDYKHS